MPPSDASATAHPPRTWITWLLIAANVAMFAIELASGADVMSPTAQKILDLGGDFAPYTLHGQWWRLGSSMFLHIGIAHLAMNMIVLWQGRIVEVLYGRLGFFAIYIASGLLGGITSVWHAQRTVSAGASGAVFGVFGAFGAYLLVRRDQIDADTVRRRAQSLASFIVINLAYGMTQKGIDLSAHIGGLITGFIVGFALSSRATSAKQITTRAIPALAAALALTVVGLLALPKPFDADGEIAAFHEVERKCIAAYNDAQIDLKAKRITTVQMVDVIEKQVLGPWRAARARLEALHDIPPQLARTFELLDQYAKDREQSFFEDQTLMSGTASADFMKQHEALKQKVHADVDAVNASLGP
jgi:rhomboid protease GluP